MGSAWGLKLRLESRGEYSDHQNRTAVESELKKVRAVSLRDADPASDG